MEKYGDIIFGRLTKLWQGDEDAVIDNTVLFSTDLGKKIAAEVKALVKEFYPALNVNGKVYQLGVNFNRQLTELAGVRPKTHEEVKLQVNTPNPADNLTLTQRIKRHEGTLYTTVMKDIGIKAAQGTTMWDIANTVRDRIRSLESANGVMMSTEANRTLNDSLLALYRNLGYKYVEFSAVLDTRTSFHCMEMDGRVFSIDNLIPLVNYPPVHPWCRSILLPSGGLQRKKGNINDRDTRFFGKQKEEGSEA